MIPNRSRDYALAEAAIISQSLKRMIPNPHKREDYKRKLKKALDHPYEERKKGEPRKESHRSELEDLDISNIDVMNPEHYAAVIRERLHRGYNARNSNLVLRVLLENL